MEKKEARKILGVTKETSINDIERKYSILLKKHRMANLPPVEEDGQDVEPLQGAQDAGASQDAQDTGASQDAQDAGTSKDTGLVQDTGAVHTAEPKHEEYSFEQVTQAYNVLMGYEVKTQEEPPSKAAPLLKKAGIDEKKARNFFYYYKYHILAAIVAIVSVVFIVKGCVTRVEPDFNIAFIGRISYSDAADKLKEAIKANVPEIKEPGFDGAFIAADDKSDQQYAMVMKATVLFAAGEVDLFILDKENYLKYAKNGAFMDLDEIAPKLGVDMEKNKENIVGIVETDIETGEEKPVSSEKHLYGLNISNSKVLKESGVIGTDFIAAIHVNGKKGEQAVKLLQFLLK